MPDDTQTTDKPSREAILAASNAYHEHRCKTFRAKEREYRERNREKLMAAWRRYRERSSWTLS